MLAGGKPDSKEKERIVVVVNTHIHWDPEYPDVKLMQVCMLMEELEAITSNNKRYAGAPFIICGDFNSMPDSGVYKYIRVRGSITHLGGRQCPLLSLSLSTPLTPCARVVAWNHHHRQEGKLESNHADFNGFDYGRYTREGLRHPFHLSSAYESIGEPTFTNFTGMFLSVVLCVCGRACACASD
jgi:CCR4-NOT transcription complex subunit 6